MPTVHSVRVASVPHLDTAAKQHVRVLALNAAQDLATASPMDPVRVVRALIATWS